MIPLAALLIFPKIKEGDSWTYKLTAHFVGPEINVTNEESLKIRVDKVNSTDIQLSFSQKLESTILDGERFPTDPKAAPAERKWTVFPNGSIAYSPPERTQIEGVFQRVLRSIMPEAPGQPARTREWTADFPEETVNLTPAAVAVFRATKNKLTIDTLSYRSFDKNRVLGSAIWNLNLPFPESLKLHFDKTRMQGGTDAVTCDMELSFSKPAKGEKGSANLANKQ